MAPSPLPGTSTNLTSVMSAPHSTRRQAHEELRSRRNAAPLPSGGVFEEPDAIRNGVNAHIPNQDLEYDSTDSLDDSTFIEELEDSEEEGEAPLQPRTGGKQATGQKASPLAPFSPTATRNKKNPRLDDQDPRNGTIPRVDRRSGAGATPQASGLQTLLPLAVGVGVVLMLLAAVLLRNPNSTSQCASGFDEPLESLTKELLNLGDFPASFAAEDFVSLFQRRIVGRPTVVHLVSESTLLPRRMVEWIHRKQPCAGKLQLEAILGNLMSLVGEKAKQFESVQVSPEQCKVLLTVTFENGKFKEENRAWLESVVDDTRPFAYTNSGQIPTGDWCIFLLDHWSGERAPLIEQLKSLPAEEIEKQVKSVTAPVWTGRWYQRVEGIFFV